MPIPTVEEILKSSGMTDEQIKALDAKVVTGITGVLTAATTESTAAQKAREEAENARRLQAADYDQKIAPALDKWGIESANLTAERDYYKTLAEKAKEGGFVAAAEPFKPTTAARGADGQFVAGANEVPGSPKFVEEKVKQLTREIGSAFSFASDTQWKYRSLFGTEMPDSPTTLIAEATAQRMEPSAYAAKKYDFAAKEAAKTAEAQKAHDDAIRAETKAASDKEWAEKVGSNPDVRVARNSEFSEIRKAAQTGKRPDPLKMTPQERQASTRAAIREDVAAHSVA
jgi:hypothetical protein